MKNQFIIIDLTSNTGKEYIASDGSNCIEENAVIFESKKEAEKFAESLNGNNNWFEIINL